MRPDQWNEPGVDVVENFAEHADRAREAGWPPRPIKLTPDVEAVTERAQLEAEVRRHGRTLNKAGAGPVDVGKCDAHGYHAACRVQTGRAHRTLEGTGDSMVAAVADLAALVEKATRKGRR